MSDFSKAVEHILNNEGGYSNRAADRGGPTNFGITIATLSQWRKKPVTPDDVKNMAKEEATLIYKTWWWDAMKLDQVNDQIVATVLFDQAVNRGVPTVVRLLQSALQVKVDGVIGAGTLAALNAVSATKMVMTIAKRCQLSYVSICQKDPTQLANLGGWISRSQKYFDLLVAN